MAADADPLLGRVIADKYELLSILGAGAMGRVYRARHRALDKMVALKVISSEQTTELQVARFEREAQTASRLEHPHSVRVLDFGEDGDDHLFYIVMELLDGRDLHQILREGGALAPARAARLLAQVCEALAVAHDLGVIHRDIKPSNVMVVPRLDENGVPTEQVKVCDFGLAKLQRSPEQDGKDPATLEGALFGTPAYMSPEQARGEPLDARSDVYSTGVLLYTVLAGEPPFSAESPVALAAMHLVKEPPKLSTVAPDVPGPLADAVRIAMAKEPSKRFQSARDLRATLVPFFDASVISNESVARAGGRAPAVIAGAVVAAATLAGVVFVLGRSPGEVTALDAGVSLDAGVKPVVHEPVVAATVAIRIQGAPRGASVHGPNGWLADLPATIELPLDGDPIPLTFRAKGYETTTRPVLPSQDRSITVRMKRVAKKRRIKARDRLENPFE